MSENAWSFWKTMEKAATAKDCKQTKSTEAQDQREDVCGVSPVSDSLQKFQRTMEKPVTDRDCKRTKVVPIVMDKPICLIENTKENQLRVNQEALNVLNSIKQPVVVMSIVGMYRTGKSYLMNRLAGKRTGFPLGSTIQSETKGIWMWCVPHPRKKDHVLVLLDTEGLGDVEKGDKNNDNWIFALAVLLSSTLVYNSIGTINNDAIMNLQHVTEVSQHIRVKSCVESTEAQTSEFRNVFPKFVWAVRDFSLELKVNGHEITADEYLENALKPFIKKGKRWNNSSEANVTRECIRKYFPVRKCFVFERPGSLDKLRRIEELTDDDLEPVFIKQTSDFCSYILSNSETKMVTALAEMNGNRLGKMVELYVDTIQSGQVPCLENAVDSLAKIVNPKAVEEAQTLYKQLMEERVVLHTETQEELSGAHEECVKEALKIFMRCLFLDTDQHYQKELMNHIKDHYNQICTDNDNLSQQHCSELLHKLWNRLNIESFMKPGGYTDYRLELDKIMKQYKDTRGKGTQAVHALEAFLKDKESIGSTILAADKIITETEKKLKEERIHAEKEKLKAETMRKEQELLKNKVADIQKVLLEVKQQQKLKTERELTQRNIELAKKGDHDRSAICVIENMYKNYSLKNPRFYCSSGTCDVSPKDVIGPEEIAYCTFVKDKPCHGAAGVLTYEILKDGQRINAHLAIMFSIPWSYVMYSNWMAVGIFQPDVECNIHLFNKMYEGKETEFKKCEGTGETVWYNKSSPYIQASMSNEYRSVIHVELREP